MPPRMMTGMKSAQLALTVAFSRWLPDCLGRGFTFSLRATISQTMTNAIAIIKPGTMPPMKSCVIETFAATPKMMQAMEGGMNGAMMQLEARRRAGRAGGEREVGV